MGGHAIKFIKIFIFGCIIILIAAVLSVNADIYRYIDDNGVMHFTNAPTSNQHDYKLYIKERASVSRKFNSTNKYDQFISDASRQTGVDFPLLKAMIKAESDFDPRAISKKGAMGLMQIMPENFQMLELKNPFDPWENIKAGARGLMESWRYLWRPTMLDPRQWTAIKAYRPIRKPKNMFAGS
jgi:soluble lytic murein transglycosylase